MTSNYLTIILSITCLLSGRGSSPHAQSLLPASLNPGVSWGTYNRDGQDVLSCSSNDASLMRLTNACVGITAQRPFMIAELVQCQFAVALPLHPGLAAVHLLSTGTEGFRSVTAGLAYARSLGNRLDLGVRFTYNLEQVRGYRKVSVPGVAISSVMHLNDRLNGGWNLRVPMKTPVPGSAWEFGYTLGLGFDASADWSAACELEKIPDQPVNARLGFIYKLHPVLWLRGGITTSGAPAWFVCCLGLKSFRLDLSAAIHNQLGVTTSISLTRQFRQKP